MKAVGLQQNTFFYGVVEDREDPEKLGRVKVRVLGVHSENQAEVPTAALPWAPVVMPATEASNSGIGWSPTGILPGTWVVVYFADGINCQNPVVLGSTVGVNPDSKPVTAEPVRTAADPKVAPKVTTTSELGHISEKYETGGRGPGFVSSGKGDLGGRSYGTFQLASTTGTLAAYLKQSKYSSKFASMPINSPEFVSTWEKLGGSETAAFKEDQRMFIEKTHFVPCASKCPFLDLGNRSQAVSEMVWSYSVQYGSAGGASKIKRALNNKNAADLSDADIVELCYNDRSANVSTDFKRSPTVHPGLIKRFASEKQDVLKEIGSQPKKDLKPADPLPKDTYDQPVESMAKVLNNPSTTATEGSAGFFDPSGKLPRKWYLGKSNTNRLARGEETTKTIQRQKKQSLVKGNGFEEPYTFSAKYPYNRVLETESGHILEFDDTKDGERIHIYHRSGSFIEFHPDGTIVKKSLKDDNEVVISNKSVYVFGNTNVFCEGEVKIQSIGNMTLESQENITIRAGASLKLEAAGNVEISAAGTMDLYSGSTITEYATMITQNNASGSKNIEVKIGDKIQASRDAAVEEEPEKTDDWGVDSGGASAQTVASKTELDKEAGFTTETAAPTTTAKEITVPPPVIKQADTASVESTDKFAGSFKLSDHYCLADLTTNTAAFKYALKEQCGLSEKEIVANLMNVAVNILEPIAAHFGRSGFIISNSFRHLKGGSSKSHHFKGMAVDLQFPGNADKIPHIAQEIRLLLPTWTQLIIEYHANNPVIHIAYAAGDLRKQIFSTYSTNFSGLKPYGIYDAKQNLIYKA